MAQLYNDFIKSEYDDLSNQEQVYVRREAEQEAERIAKRYASRHPQFLEIIANMLMAEARTLVTHARDKKAKSDSEKARKALFGERK